MPERSARTPLAGLGERSRVAVDGDRAPVDARGEPVQLRRRGNAVRLRRARSPRRRPRAPRRCRMRRRWPRSRRGPARTPPASRARRERACRPGLALKRASSDESRYVDMRATTPSRAAATAAAALLRERLGERARDLRVPHRAHGRPLERGERPAPDPGHVAAAREDRGGADRLQDGAAAGGEEGVHVIVPFRENRVPTQSIRCPGRRRGARPPRSGPPRGG